MDHGNFSFRLNPHTFVRNFGSCIYMENQVNHVKGYFNGWAYTLARNIFHSYTTFGFWNDHRLQSFDHGNNEARIFQRTNGKVPVLAQRDVGLSIFMMTPGSREETTFPINVLPRSRQDLQEKMCGSPATCAPTRGGCNGLQINITDACNERCRHCYLPGQKKDRAHCHTCQYSNRPVETVSQYEWTEGGAVGR